MGEGQSCHLAEQVSLLRLGRRGGGEEEGGALLQQSAADFLVGAEEDEAAGADEGHSGDTACEQTEGGGEDGEVLMIFITLFTKKKNIKILSTFLMYILCLWKNKPMTNCK